MLAEVYTQAFRHAGYLVTHVTGAQSAIDAADQETPDIVVLELHLIGHSGVEFLHEFRSYAEWMHIPVVLNTSLPPARITALADALVRDLGVCDILYKPRASLLDILRAVRQVTRAV